MIKKKKEKKRDEAETQLLREKWERRQNYFRVTFKSVWDFFLCVQYILYKVRGRLNSHCERKVWEEADLAL